MFLIEDTCEALGSKFKSKYLGTFGDFGTILLLFAPNYFRRRRDDSL